MTEMAKVIEIMARFDKFEGYTPIKDENGKICMLEFKDRYSGVLMVYFFDENGNIANIRTQG